MKLRQVFRYSEVWLVVDDVDHHEGPDWSATDEC